jgi:hypothetical protein
MQADPNSCIRPFKIDQLSLQVNQDGEVVPGKPSPLRRHPDHAAFRVKLFLTESQRRGIFQLDPNHPSSGLNAMMVPD